MRFRFSCGVSVSVSVSVSDSDLRSQTCYGCFGFLNISLNLQYLSWNPWQSLDFYNIFEDFSCKYCEFHIFLWLEFFLCAPFTIFWHICIFYPYLEVYGHVLGMCYNFTNQDFVVFPVSATTSLIFCKIIYIQPSLSNSWFITRWVYKGTDCKCTFRVVVHLALCGNHMGWKLIWRFLECYFDIPLHCFLCVCLSFYSFGQFHYCTD